MTESAPCCCDNCGHECTEDELGKSLFEIHHLAERLDPGCTVPAGECPECGALSYLIEDEDNTVPDLTAALQSILHIETEDGLTEYARRCKMADIARTALANLHH